MQTQESCVKCALRGFTGWFQLFLLLVLPLAVMPILANWVGDVGKGLLKDTALGGMGHAAMFWIGLAALLVLAALLLWMGHKLLPVNIIAQTPSFEQRRVVVALLSPCDVLEKTDGKWQVNVKDGQPIQLSCKTLEQLVDKNCRLPNMTWQQTLRAANYHRVRLEKLVLVGSLGGSGTKKQLDQAREFFSTWFPGKVVAYGSPVQADDDYDTRWQADFEDLAGLGKLLDNLLRELHKDTAGYSDRDIIIDCTGGFKTASIAAALATLHRPELMFQYVGTGEHAGRVTGFNVATGHVGA